MAKVLVVDDSALMRRLISGVLGDHGYQVVAARNGAEAVQQLLDTQPDVVTLDINMPEMDGLTALSLMMQARPTPVVMVSSLTERGAQATLEALALGAVDFIAKPGGTISLSIEDISEQLLSKVRAASRARLRGMAPAARAAGDSAARSTPTKARERAQADERGRAEAQPAARAAAARPQTGQHSGQLCGLVLVGVSTGGPRTLEDILPALPADFPWPVVVAQHMPPNFTEAFARRMDAICRLRVRECNSTMPLEPGQIYIGQGGTDVVVVERLGRLAVQPRPETPGHPWHPSVDVLVDSAMKLVPPERLVGVQLTGMGFDGAEAMARLHQRGGKTIAESKDTAVVYGMPAELIDRGGASVVLPCQAVARQLCTWAQRLH